MRIQKIHGLSPIPPAHHRQTHLFEFYTGWRRIPWTHVEITGGGPPRVNLYGKAQQRAELLGVVDIKITITHTRSDAMVFVISQKEHT